MSRDRLIRDARRRAFNSNSHGTRHSSFVCSQYPERRRWEGGPAPKSSLAAWATIVSFASCNRVVPGARAGSGVPSPSNPVSVQPAGFPAEPVTKRAPVRSRAYGVDRLGPNDVCSGRPDGVRRREGKPDSSRPHRDKRRNAVGGRAAAVVSGQITPKMHGAKN